MPYSELYALFVLLSCYLAEIPQNAPYQIVMGMMFICFQNPVLRETAMIYISLYLKFSHRRKDLLQTGQGTAIMVDSNSGKRGSPDEKTSCAASGSRYDDRPGGLRQKARRDDPAHRTRNGSDH